MVLRRAGLRRVTAALFLTASITAAAQQEELGDVYEKGAAPPAEAPTPPAAPAPEAPPPRGAPTAPGAPPAPGAAPPVAPGAPGVTAPSVGRPPVSSRFELKRQLSNRGAIDESSRTTLRAELLLDSPLTLVRVELPFVDKNNSFTSDPLNAGLGDLKTRFAFTPIPVPGAPVAFFLELVFPTAEGTLGYGKYQVAPGVTSSIKVAPWREPVLLFAPLVEQYLSFAGDPTRSPIDYTYTELNLEARWPHLRLSLNPKPTIDWTKGVSSAAVLELQATWIISSHWRLWIKGGQRLWGGTLPGTYDQQLETGVRWTP